MANYAWPPENERTYLGKRITRVDGPAKVSGRAKYTQDFNPKGLLYGALVTCPYAHAKVVSVDTSAAERMHGVKAVKVIQTAGKEIHWAGDEIVALAAVDERTAWDAVRAVKVEYQPLPHTVLDAVPPPEQVGEDTSPISAEELGDMYDNQVPDDDIAAALKKRGVNFHMTPDMEKEWKGYGVSDEAIASIKAAPFKSGEAGPKSPFKRTAVQKQGEPDEAFKNAAAVSEGTYGIPVITHCCLESHGAASLWPDEKNLEVHISTQNLSGIAPQMAEGLRHSKAPVPASNIRVLQQYIGGGFGSKFGPDTWGNLSAELSKLAGGAPVKLMLDRKLELEVAGSRPSAYAKIRVACDKDGSITGWDSNSWATGGISGGGSPPLPYVFQIPNQQKVHTAVACNIGSSRAWRAPNHPQAALLTMSALDDAAAKMNMDPLEFFIKNIALTGTRAKLYEEELRIAAELSNWKQLWHPRSQLSQGPIKRGLGLSIHTWGGRGHESHCDLTIHPDGAVDLKMGTQDLGTGTRTAILIVAADTLGVPMEAIHLMIGDTRFPMSGGSGGSTTIGGVSSSTRRGAVDLRDQLLAKVAPSLKAKPDELEIVKGTVRVKADPSRSLSWKDACAKIGPVPLTVRGDNFSTAAQNKQPDLTNSGVGGCQVADVSVDTETGIVKVNRMVAVQDIGLVVSEKTAESQIHGALIMGITYALFEEKVMDKVTGRMLNPNMEFYRLAGISDIGELIVKLMRGPEQDKRGVIGLGEPPVVSPGAAISNAVANALGVRVPMLPLTPDRVLDTLAANPTQANGGAL
jgi:xanthine dehydrogenase YagR molybdenum-binding subunit